MGGLNAAKSSAKVRQQEPERGRPASESSPVDWDSSGRVTLSARPAEAGPSPGQVGRGIEARTWAPLAASHQRCDRPRSELASQRAEKCRENQPIQPI